MNKIFKIIAKSPTIIRRIVRSWFWQRIFECPELNIGDGAQIIGENRMRIGKGFRAGRMLWLEAVTQYGFQELTPNLIIGERLSVSDCVHIACAFKLTIGNDVLLGSKVHITDHNHGKYRGTTVSLPNEPPAKRILTGSPVYIGNNVFICDGVVVLPGTYIEDGVIIGANSVVNGHLSSYTMYVGTPAKAIKFFDIEKKSWCVIQ
jgi:acetyltransferase-like isoleucine patch superfamily enzyme